MVYLFAGLAKLNADWLLEAQPLRTWLAARSDLPLLGPVLDESWVAFAASWLGAAYDLTIVVLLFHRRTRQWAFVAVVIFRLPTWILFRIGIFPWLMIISTMLYFPADWPRRLLGRWVGTPYLVTGSSPVVATQGRLKPLGLAGLACYVAVQLFLPLRHHLHDESSAWTQQGFNWSWRVMLVEKNGYAEFRAFDPATGKRWKIAATDYLTRRQAQFMAQDPAMIRALSRAPSRSADTPGSRCTPTPTLR